MEAIKRYRCGSCEEVHRSYGDALDCCAPSPEEVFCCSKCDQVFDNSADADDCCSLDGLDIDGKVLMATPAELEAAGQLRLALQEVRP